nr:hypothetical protein [Paraburkholderia sp. UCT31]
MAKANLSVEQMRAAIPRLQKRMAELQPVEANDPGISSLEKKLGDVLSELFSGTQTGNASVVMRLSMGAIASSSRCCIGHGMDPDEAFSGTRRFVHFDGTRDWIAAHCPADASGRG